MVGQDWVITSELMDSAKRIAIAFYEWARVYNMSHMTEHLQAGKLPTVEELWEKFEQAQQK